MIGAAYGAIKPPLCFLLWVFVCSLALAAPPQQVLLDGFQSQQAENNRLGAVASENRVCSQIGIDMLKAGGNAADAVRIFLS